MSVHGAVMALNGESLGHCFGLSMFYYYYDFLMFQTNLIMTQYQIYCLHNTKDFWLVLIGGTLCLLFDQVRPKTGDLSQIFWFLSVCINIFSS